MIPVRGFESSFQEHKICFAGTNITVCSNAHFGESSGPYHLDNVNCGGYEANLLVCSRQYTSGGVYNNGIDVHNCAAGNEAGVKCDGMCMECDFHAFTKQLLCAMKHRMSASI